MTPQEAIAAIRQTGGKHPEAALALAEAWERLEGVAREARSSLALSEYSHDWKLRDEIDAALGDTQ